MRTAREMDTMNGLPRTARFRRFAVCVGVALLLGVGVVPLMNAVSAATPVPATATLTPTRPPPTATTRTTVTTTATTPSASPSPTPGPAFALPGAPTTSSGNGVPASNSMALDPGTTRDAPGLATANAARPSGSAGFAPGVPSLPATPSAGAMSAAGCVPFAQAGMFAAPGFGMQWQMGEALAANFWGPAGNAPSPEQYREATGGSRLVQYFDKGRMELADPAAGTVTNGLLASELVSGQMQVGDSTFENRGAARIPVAGDPDNAGPTYADLGGPAAALLAATPARMGTMVTTTVAANGAITDGMMLTGTGSTAISAYDDATRHNVPQAFAEYRARAGLAAIGLAKSEPFLATVKVGGVQRQVLVQVFERRVLTYTADNAEAFRVEMGNIGQHYYRWRYCGA